MGGSGTYKSNEGVVAFEGQFKQDLMHGSGTYNYADGRKYSGRWYSGHMHGHATMSWPDGSQYIGGYSCGKQEGVGKLILPDGRVYRGCWHQGVEQAASMSATPGVQQVTTAAGAFFFRNACLAYK